MPPARPWEERLTPIDLFVEKRKITKAWRTIASVSVGLVGMGCLLYPFAIRNDQAKSVSYPTLTTAVGLVVVGHVLEAFAVLRQKSILYWLEDLFLPILHIAILAGIIAPVLHILYRQLTATVPLVGVFIVSGLSLLLHVPASIIINRRLSQIERADTLRRQRVAASPSSPWPTRYNSTKSGSSFTLSTRSISSRLGGHGKAKISPSFPSNYLDDGGLLIPEDEAQRQQLMKLLMKREDESRPPVVTGPKGGGVQITYRLDMPMDDDDADVARRRHISVPGPSTGRGRQSHTEGYRPHDDAIAFGSSTAPPGMIALQDFREYPQLRPPPRRHESSTAARDSHETSPSHAPEPSRSNSGRSGGANSSSSLYADSPTSSTALHPTASQTDRERRRQEIEQGVRIQRSDDLPPYAAGQGIVEDQRDDKGQRGFG